MSDAKALGIFLIGFVSFVSVLVGSLYLKNKYACETRFENSSVSSQYRMFTGCLVKTPKDGWIPANNYRVF